MWSRAQTVHHTTAGSIAQKNIAAARYLRRRTSHKGPARSKGRAAVLTRYAPAASKPATNAVEFFWPARSIARRAAMSSTVKISSLIRVVLRKTTHGLTARVADNAKATNVPNPTHRNQRQASARRSGSINQANGRASLRFPGKLGSIFQSPASNRGHNGGYLVSNGSAGKLRIRYPVPSASDLAETQ